MAALEWLWARLTPPYHVPTPIPQYVVDWFRRHIRQSPLDRIWQLLLIVIGGALVVAALSSGMALVAAIAGIVISIHLADDIRQTTSDIWNRRFWIWEVDP